MYLRDIDLSIPHIIKAEVIENLMIEQGITYEQAVQKDYEENWKWNIIRRFTLETRCMTSMFLRIMGNLKTKDCSKVLIKCVTEKAWEGVSSYMGVYTLEHLLDYDNFFIKSDYEKKIITLNIIQESIKKIVSDKLWDFAPFNAVFNKIIALDYNNSWTWGKKIKNPNRIHTAEVFLDHKVKDIDIYIYIRNKKDEIIEKKLILTELPHEFSYARHLGKLVWVSENEVQLNNKLGDKVGSMIL